MKSLLNFAAFVSLFSFCVTQPKYGYVTWKGGDIKLSLTDHLTGIPEVHVAKATYDNAFNKTGWAYLEVHTSEAESNVKQAYSAGYLEGYLTRDLIWMHWQNILKGYCYNKTDVCASIDQFVDTNEKYIANMVEKNPGDAYWHQVKLVYTQIEGLTKGYNDATEDPSQMLTVRDLVWMNMLGDLEDLAVAVTLPPVLPEAFLFGEHCTGLVKLLPDHSDLYTSQVTWNSYQSMLRIQKKYSFKFHMSDYDGTIVPGHTVSFSSYPSIIESLDDFYVITTGLTVGETTLANSNQSLYSLVQPEGQLMEFVRVVLANRLAEDGASWVDIFRRHNSGTYNNQWYVVDYNKFRPKHNTESAMVKPGLLWVLEQLPGYTEAADLTEHLVKTTNWPSYNIPYFPSMFNLSGGQERIKEYGDWFGYYTNPRARILQQKQADITDVDSMLRVLRYNDFKHDPLSRCDVCDPPYSANNAIAARDDLNLANGTYPFHALGHRSHGATDLKMTTVDLQSSLQFIAVSGPTYNISYGIQPFAWSQFDLGEKISHVGHPDLWMFPTVLHDWQWG